MAMDAKLVPIKTLLNEKNQQNRYLVPVFQRGYVWGQTDQWEPLWEDIETVTLKRLNSSGRVMPHFIGAVVISQLKKASISTYGIIDGQQRLITIQLILAALHRCADEFGVQSVVRKIPEYIFNKKSNMLEGKVIPNARRNGEDRKLFNDILSMPIDELYNNYPNSFRYAYPPVIQHRKSRGEMLFDRRSEVPRLLGAFGFFYEKIKHFAEANDKKFTKSRCFDAIFNALILNLTVVRITLGRKDNAQVIFETVNGRGQPLLQTDLIKNDIFRRAGGENAEELFNDYWSYFEESYWEQEIAIRRQKKITLDDYFQCFLESKWGKPVELPHLFSSYKRYIAENPYKKNVKSELADLIKYAKIYKELSEGSDESELGKIAQEINILNAKTIYPLILSLWGNKKQKEKDKLQCITYLISFIIRRAICGYNDKNYNKYFLDIIKEMNAKKDFWTVKNLVIILKEYTTETRLFPIDSTFETALIKREAYKRGVARYMLSKIEENINPEKNWRELCLYGNEVEHVLPREWVEYWRLSNDHQPSEEELLDARERYTDDFSPESKYGRINRRDRLLHALGNLTLLDRTQNYNADNLPFADKLAIYAEDELELEITKTITEYSEWAEDQIIERGENLYKVVKKIWPGLPNI